MPRPGSAHCNPRKQNRLMLTRRLYYDDSFEREFTAKVLACEPAAVPASPEAKAPAWEVILDRTAFYPSSGGQPHDLGNLGDSNVLDVREHEDEIIQRSINDVDDFIFVLAHVQCFGRARARR